MIDWAFDKFHLFVIRTLRMYGLHPVSKIGLWRINEYVSRAASSLHGQYSFPVRARDGRTFLINPQERQYHMGLLGLGVFEPQSTELVTMAVREGSIVIDIGANYGWFTTLMSRLVGEHGEVHSFEPMAKTFQLLKTNCKINNCKNTYLNNCGLSSEKEQALIHFFPGQPCGNASLFNPSNTPAETTMVELTTLDFYMEERRITRLDFIKCDAEFTEKRILQGGTRTLKAHNPIILIEVHESSGLYGYEPCELLQEIEQHGPYRFVLLNEKGGYHEILSLTEFRVKDYANVLCLPGQSPLVASLRI